MIEIQPHIPENLSQQKTFKINIQKLEEQFQCTVCLNPIQDCYVTRCGHVFCKKCIEETINRHHRCPFCNQGLKQFKEDVFKNYHFNTIRKIVDEQKDKQAKKYLQKVFNSDKLNKVDKQNEEIEILLRPVEEKIVKFCEKALLQYRKFLIGMFELEKKTQEKKALLGISSIRDHNKIIQQLQSLIETCLRQPIVAPQTLQLSTKIEIGMPGNKLGVKNVKISPLLSFESLLPTIQEICKQNNVQILGKISQQFIINGSKQKITEKIGMYAGGKIKIQAGIPFESKIYCFTHNWFKEKKSNFSICQTCKIKWICENCGLYCHEGHILKPQLKDHKPDWAICYCVSKSECRAINKNSID